MNSSESISNKLSAINWPKYATELHVHLGGAVPLYRLWEMGVERGIRGLGAGYEDFINLVKVDKASVHDLDSYLEVYDRIELIQSGPSAVRESIIIAALGLHRTGGMRKLGPYGEGGDPKPLFKLGRLELRFNPLKRTGAVFLKGQHAGLYDVDRIIKSAAAAVEDLELGFKGKIQIGLIFCLGRDMTFEANLVLAEKIAEWREKSPKIIGLDLAGPESANPLSEPKQIEELKKLYEIAGKNIGKTLHAGETPYTTIDSFLKTIEAINPNRIAHPIVALRAYWEMRDDRGLKILKERDIVCELCVQSNLLTGAVKSLSEYERVINTLDDFGIRYTFSTDAPALQVTSLAEELMLLLTHTGITGEQVVRALSTAEEASFLST